MTVRATVWTNKESFKIYGYDLINNKVQFGDIVDIEPRQNSPEDNNSKILVLSTQSSNKQILWESSRTKIISLVQSTLFFLSIPVACLTIFYYSLYQNGAASLPLALLNIALSSSPLLPLLPYILQLVLNLRHLSAGITDQSELSKISQYYHTFDKLLDSRSNPDAVFESSSSQDPSSVCSFAKTLIDRRLIQTYSNLKLSTADKEDDSRMHDGLCEVVDISRDVFASLDVVHIVRG